MPAANLTDLLDATSAACGIWFSVDADGLWIDGQRPNGAAKGMGKTLDTERLSRALPEVIRRAPQISRGNLVPTAPIWAVVQEEYKKAARNTA